MASTDIQLDEARLQDFIGRFAGDVGAALHQTTVIIGDKLGLYAGDGRRLAGLAGEPRGAHGDRRSLRPPPRPGGAAVSARR